MTEFTKQLRERRMLGMIGVIGHGRAESACCWLTEEPDPDCTEAADTIEAQAERVRVLREALQGLEAMAERYRAPGQPMPDAQKVARAAVEATQ